MIAAPKKVRSETLPIAKKFNKYVPLPNSSNWRVHESDVLAKGSIMTLLRTKYLLLPDHLSALCMRSATITKHGFLVLYQEVDRGLIIDLRSANCILTNCDSYKGRHIRYRRCHVKIRYPRGNVHIFLRDDDIGKWTNAIMTAHTTARSKPLEPVKKIEEEGEMTAIEQEQEKVVADIDAIPSADIHLNNDNTDSDRDVPSSSSNSGLITVIENKPSVTNQMPSVRCGPLSVRCLRKKLEQRLVMKPVAEVMAERSMKKMNVSAADEQQFVSSIFVFHRGVKEEEESETEQVDEEDDAVIAEQTITIPAMSDEEPKKSENKKEKGQKKEWWMRSLRC